MSIKRFVRRAAETTVTFKYYVSSLSCLNSQEEILCLAVHLMKKWTSCSGFPARMSVINLFLARNTVSFNVRVYMGSIKHLCYPGLLKGFLKILSVDLLLDQNCSRNSTSPALNLWKSFGGPVPRPEFSGAVPFPSPEFQLGFREFQNKNIAIMGNWTTILLISIQVKCTMHMHFWVVGGQ